MEGIEDERSAGNDLIPNVHHDEGSKKLIEPIEINNKSSNCQGHYGNSTSQNINVSTPVINRGNEGSYKKGKGLREPTAKILRTEALTTESQPSEFQRIDSQVVGSLSEKSQSEKEENKKFNASDFGSSENRPSRSSSDESLHSASLRVSRGDSISDNSAMISINVSDMTKMQNHLLELKTTNNVLEERLLNLMLESGSTSFQPTSFFNRLSRTVLSNHSSVNEADQLRSQLDHLQATLSQHEAEKEDLVEELMVTKSALQLLRTSDNTSSAKLQSEEHLENCSSLNVPNLFPSDSNAESIVHDVIRSCQLLFTSSNIKWAFYRVEYPNETPNQSNILGQSQSPIENHDGSLVFTLNSSCNSSPVQNFPNQSSIGHGYPAEIPFSSIARAVALLLDSIQVLPFHTSSHSQPPASLSPPHSPRSSLSQLPSEISSDSVASYSPTLVVAIPTQLQSIIRQTPPSSSPDVEDKTKKYLEKISQQQKELQVLHEIVARQTQQLTQLSLQVTDFKTEIDDVASLNLVEKVASLEERSTVLTEENQSLEAQLEDLKTQVVQAFEMKCALQKMYFDLEEKDLEIKKLQSQLNAALIIEVPPPPMNQHQKFSSVESRVGIVAPAATFAEDGDNENDIECDDTPEKDDECRNLEEEKSNLLLENVSLLALEAELKSEAEELKSQIENLKAENGSIQIQMEELESSKIQLEKKYQRELIELRNLVRREREAKTEVEAECQRLLSRTLEINSKLSNDLHSYHSPSSSSSKHPPSISLLPPHVRMSGIASSLAVENQPREQLSHEQMLAVQSQMCQLKTSIEALKEQLQQKTDIVNYLLKKFGLNEETFRGPMTQTKSSGGFLGLFTSSSSASPLSPTEMQKVVEETLLENIRLRQDLQTIGQELRCEMDMQCIPSGTQ